MPKRMPRATPKIQALKRRIQRIDLVCSGTLLARTKVCGKPTCACASDPDARHGPYYEWSRWETQSLRHRNLSPAEARIIHRAQENRQVVLEILTEWEDETTRIVLGPERASRSRAKR